ncbi:hypothetical protein QTP88_024347 [Uroleucon formosanum]
MWNEVKIVHGKPRHSQSQGSVERANRDVQEKLAAWMGDNNSSDWPSALRFIQFKKNRAFHLGTEHGFLKYNYTRQEIAACEENLLDMDNVIKLGDGRQLTLRETASNSSVAGPQGYQRCHCKTGCNNKRCACRGAEMLCNSK